MWSFTTFLWKTKEDIVKVGALSLGTQLTFIESTKTVEMFFKIS